MDANNLQAAADRLSVRLEGLDLDDDERVVLRAIFAAAADAAASDESEVAGFALPGQALSDGLAGRQFQLAVPEDDPKPSESLSLNFTKISFTYRQQ